MANVIRWAIEGAPNPTLLRLHVSVELTDETIVTCPPATPPEPLDRLFEIEAIRSIDLHRYRARINLRPGGPRAETTRHVTEILTPAWGPPTPLAPDPGPRAFESDRTGVRTVAESPAMAESHPTLRAAFAVDGVAEAIAGDGLILVRLGRLYAWSDREAEVARAVQTAGGMPGSTSSPV